MRKSFSAGGLAGIVLLGAIAVSRAAPPTPITLSPLPATQERALKPGDTFRECAPRQPEQDYCPDMVVVPAGTFMMGSAATDKHAYRNEVPQHRVTIAKPFAVAKFELTFAEWDACVAAGGCNAYRPSNMIWGRGQQPVINVSWADAQAYVAWLARTTGKPYRLLSEAEYEYAARAGSTTEYPWGDDANCAGCASPWDKRQTAPVGSFSAGGFIGTSAANAFGLNDMVGNVWQWTQDCYHADYTDAPADGSAWSSGDCRRHAVRGLSWVVSPLSLRSASRDGNTSANRSNILGFRVARTLVGP